MPFEIELGWQVKAAMRSLNPFELGEVNAAINRLREGRFGELPQPYKVREQDGSSAYVLQVDKSLRILYALEADRVVIQDLVRKELAGRFG